MTTPQIGTNPKDISFPYVTDPCQIYSFMIRRPDCANLETGTLTVDKVCTLAIMNNKRSQWGLEASLMGLENDIDA